MLDFLLISLPGVSTRYTRYSFNIYTGLGHFSTRYKSLFCNDFFLS